MTPRKNPLQDTPVRRSERIRVLREVARIAELKRLAEERQREHELQAEVQPRAAAVRTSRFAPRRTQGGGVKRRRRVPRRSVASGQEFALAHFERFMYDILRVARERFTGQDAPHPCPPAPPRLEAEQQPTAGEVYPVNEQCDIIFIPYSSSDSEFSYI